MLVACVREHDWGTSVATVAEGLHPNEALDFVDAARFHGVEACVYLSLRGSPALSAEASEYLERAYFDALRRHVEAQRGVEIAASVLDAAGIPWIVLKGPALAALLYTRSDLRSYGDLDLLVPPAAFRDAVDAFDRAGHQMLDRNWRAIVRDLNGQLHVQLASGLTVDLHWNVVNSRYFRSVFPIETDALVRRSRPVVVGGVTSRALGPTDTLLHLALHACLTGGNRLIWLKDIEQAILHDEPLWPELIQRAREWHAEVALASMLGSARRTLDARVPSSALGALTSPAWRGLGTLAEWLTPAGAETGGDSVPLLLHRAVRAGEARSLRELARRGARWLGGQRPLGGFGAGGSGQASATLLDPSGGDAERDRYFSAVTAEGSERRV